MNRHLAFWYVVTALLCADAFGQSTSTAPVTLKNGCTDADFWLGDWEVRESDGIKIANVTVATHVGHCILLEDLTWTVDTFMSRGNAIFIMAYSDAGHDWRYDGGSVYGQRYNFVDGKLAGRELKFRDAGVPQGVTAYFSYVSLPDERINDIEIQSEDGGKSWQTIRNVFWYKVKK